MLIGPQMPLYNYDSLGRKLKPTKTVERDIVNVTFQVEKDFFFPFETKYRISKDLNAVIEGNQNV